MSGRWKTIDRFLDKGASPLGMSAPHYAELAVRIHEAVASSDPSELQDFVAQLAKAVDVGRATASVAARSAAEGSCNVDASEKGAFALGQLVFAYQVAANALNGRADKGFEQRLRVGPLAPIVDALSRGELSGAELAEKLDCAPETVSRKLQELRATGAVDFRRMGTRLVNFLTPAAKQLLGITEDGPSLERPHIAAPVRRWVGDKVQEQVPIMRDAQSFARMADAE